MLSAVVMAFVLGLRAPLDAPEPRKRGHGLLPRVPGVLDVDSRHKDVCRAVVDRAGPIYSAITGGLMSGVRTEVVVPGPESSVKRMDVLISGTMGDLIVESKAGWVPAERVLRQLWRYGNGYRLVGRPVAKAMAAPWSLSGGERESLAEERVRYVRVPLEGCSLFDYTVSHDLVLPALDYVVVHVGESAVVLERPGHVLAQFSRKAFDQFRSLFPNAVPGSVVRLAARVESRRDSDGKIAARSYWGDSGHPGCTWSRRVRPDVDMRPTLYFLEVCRVAEEFSRSLILSFRKDEFGFGYEGDIDVAERWVRD